MKSEEKTRDRLRVEIFFVYVKMRRHLGKNKGYTPLYTQKELTLIENFLKLLESRYELSAIGGDFFIDYFLFSFCFWSGRDSTTSKNSGAFFSDMPMLNWIIGKKGFERWINRKDNWRFWVKKNNITIPPDLLFAKNTLSTLTKKVEKTFSENKIFTNFKSEQLLKINDFEEADKKMFHNTDYGLINCTNNTTLYNKKSLFCIKCKFSKECKKIMITEFPEIANLRGIV